MKNTTYKNWKLCIRIYKTIYPMLQYCVLQTSLYSSKNWQWVGDLLGGFSFNLKHTHFYDSIMLHCILLPCPLRYFESVHPYLSHRCALFQQTAAKLRYLKIKEIAKDYQYHNISNILSNSRHLLFYKLLPLFVDCSNINAVSVVLKKSPSFWRALNISNLWKFALSSLKVPIFKSLSTYKRKYFWKCMRIAPIYR